IVWDREFGFLREMLVAPVSRSAIVIGKCIGGALVATLQGAVIVALAGLAGGPYDPLLLAELVAVMFLGAFALTGFGVMMAARITQMQSFFAVMQMAMLPMMFLSGALYPLHGLPAWLSVLTKLNPLTYAVDPMRQAVFARLDLSPALQKTFSSGVTWNGWLVPLWLELRIVAGMAVVLMAVAILQFRRAEWPCVKNRARTPGRLRRGMRRAWAGGAAPARERRRARRTVSGGPLPRASAGQTAKSSSGWALL